MFELAAPSSLGRAGGGCPPGGAGRLRCDPSPDVKAGDSWHKEPWWPGGSWVLGCGAVLPAEGLVLVRMGRCKDPQPDGGFWRLWKGGTAGEEGSSGLPPWGRGLAKEGLFSKFLLIPGLYF